MAIKNKVSEPESDGLLKKLAIGMVIAVIGAFILSKVLPTKQNNLPQTETIGNGKPKIGR